jgi:hypothetical protein
MKLRLIASFVALAGTSFGALVTVESLQTFDGVGDTGFKAFDTGNPLTTGLAQIGIFSTLTDSQVGDLASAKDLVSVLAGFSSLGQDNFTNVATAYGAAIPGLISMSNPSFVPTAGETLYSLVTSGGGWALFKHNSVLTADPAPPSLPNSYNLTLTDGQILVGTAGGTYTANYTDLGGSASTTVGSSIQLYGAVIPEPSAALLGALGALGLLRRRRN